MKYLFIIYIALLCPFLLSAQKVKKARGEYIYAVSENVTIEQAKQIAIDNAKLKAIENEFGAIVSQDNYFKISNQQKDQEVKSEIDFLSFGSSNIKGEWIEDIESPKIDIFYENNLLVIHASVYGKIREITSSKIDLDIKTLRNGVEKHNENESFNNGDNLYLSFKSPKKGYLAIYLADKSDSIYCLLPYRKMQEGVMQIDANKEYIFFNRDYVSPPIERRQVDQYKLFCSSSSEQNQLYIIYSTDPLVKANDDESLQTIGELKMPRSLSFEDFQKWLSKNKTNDKNLQVEIRNITIFK